MKVNTIRFVTKRHRLVCISVPKKKKTTNQYSNIASKLHYYFFRCNLSSNSNPVNLILEAKTNSRVDRVL